MAGKKLQQAQAHHHGEHHHDWIWKTSVALSIFSGFFLGFITFGACVLLFPAWPLWVAWIAFFAGGITEAYVFFANIQKSLRKLVEWSRSDKKIPLDRTMVKKIIAGLFIFVFAAGFATWYALNGFVEVQGAFVGLSHLLGVGISFAAQPWLLPIIIVSLVIMGIGYFLWVHTSLRNVHRDLSRVGKNVKIFFNALKESYHKCSTLTAKGLYGLKAIGKTLLLLGVLLVSALVTLAMAGLNSKNPLIYAIAVIAFLPVALVVNLYLAIKTYKRILDFFSKENRAALWKNFKESLDSRWLNPFWYVYQILKTVAFLVHCASMGLIGGAGAVEGSILRFNRIVMILLGALQESVEDLALVFEKEEGSVSSNEAESVVVDGGNGEDAEENEEEDDHVHFDVLEFLKINFVLRWLGALWDCMIHLRCPNMKNLRESKDKLFPADEHHCHHYDDHGAHEGAAAVDAVTAAKGGAVYVPLVPVAAFAAAVSPTPPADAAPPFSFRSLVSCLGSFDD